MRAQVQQLTVPSSGWPDDANEELFVMRSNGTGVRQITATNGLIEWGAEWQRASSR
jgi:hypothetical protein